MKENDFLKALKFVLKWEGFISDDPNDPGGLTIWGISYKSYPKQVMEMKVLIGRGDKEEAFKIAEKIYYENYWIKSGCDKLEYPLNIVVFNCSVNCGRSRAKEIFLLSVDWKDFLLKQIEFYASLKGAKYYLRGWVNRTISLFNLIKKEENNEHN